MFTLRKTNRDDTKQNLHTFFGDFTACSAPRSLGHLEILIVHRVYDINYRLYEETELCMTLFVGRRAFPIEMLMLCMKNVSALKLPYEYICVRIEDYIQYKGMNWI